MPSVYEACCPLEKTETPVVIVRFDYFHFHLYFYFHFHSHHHRIGVLAGYWFVGTGAHAVVRGSWKSDNGVWAALLGSLERP